MRVHFRDIDAAHLHEYLRKLIAAWPPDPPQPWSPEQRYVFNAFDALGAALKALDDPQPPPRDQANIPCGVCRAHPGEQHKRHCGFWPGVVYLPRPTQERASFCSQMSATYIHYGDS